MSAWKEGYAAASLGRSRAACPYPPESQSAGEWFDGFNRSMRDDQPDYEVHDPPDPPDPLVELVEDALAQGEENASPR